MANGNGMCDPRTLDELTERRQVVLKTPNEKSGGAEQLKSFWTDFVRDFSYKVRSRQHVKVEFDWT